MEYEYKKGKFIKNGHTMFEQDVLTDLKRLAYLEEERSKQLTLTSVVFTLPSKDESISRLNKKVADIKEALESEFEGDVVIGYNCGWIDCYNDLTK